MRHFDVVIVGAAIVGSSTAYFLRKNGFKGSIALVEKDPTYARACTSLSWGGIRRQFSNPENIQLSTFGLNLIRNLTAEFGPSADISFRERGYLVLASADGAPVLEENAALQNSLGADTVLLTATELKRRFPFANFDGIALASWGRSGEGWFDPYGLMTLIRKAALGRDVMAITDEVVAIDANDRVNGVILKSGERLGAGALVNAAGASAGAVAAMVGFELPVAPAKRYNFIADCPGAPQGLRNGPAWFDISGVYFRPEGRNFIFGFTPTPEEEPKIADWEMEHHWFEEKIWPVAAGRLPCFETLKIVSSYVGHYDYNWFDQNGIIGRHPSLPNFYFGNGFSGHGIQQGPATGNAIAELICYGEYRTVNLSRMGVERILRGERLLEKNIF